MKKIILIISLLLVIASCNKENTENESKVVQEKQPEQNIVVETTDNLDSTNTGVTMDAPTFTKEEVAIHNKKDDCFTIIDGKVYDVTSFFGKHPGGDANILKLCGIDGSLLFNRKHGENEKAIMTKDTFFVGDIK